MIKGDAYKINKDVILGSVLSALGGCNQTNLPLEMG